VVTFIYWVVLVPQDQTTVPNVKAVDPDQYREFFVVSTNIINSVVAFIEIFFLSSIRRQEPVGGHLAGLAALSALYVIWAFIGNEVTGEFAYFFFDHDQIGWEHVTGAIIAFILAGDIAFSFVYGLTGLREMNNNRSEDRSGYNRLPQ